MSAHWDDWPYWATDDDEPFAESEQAKDEWDAFHAADAPERRGDAPNDPNDFENYYDNDGEY